jgi:predicted phosphodiesterase
MRIGLLADIHEATDFLDAALTHFDDQGVDQVVLLGDVFDTGQNLEPVVRRLLQANAGGVWGNHELGLCHEVEPDVLERYPPLITNYFARLHPRWEFERYLATHALPTLDYADPLAYYESPRPDEEAARGPCFAQFPGRVMVMGHYHRWFAATPDGIVAWKGERPLDLSASAAWLIVIHAVAEGWCAVLDTSRETLFPHRLPVADAINP